MTKIAIIEDDIGLNKGIELALKREDYVFYPFYSLGEVQNIEQMDLIILDINLPDGNGLVFLRKLRESSGVPVLILLAAVIPYLASRSLHKRSVVERMRIAE